MVSPSQRRAVVAWAQQAYQVSERRACRGFAIHRAMIRYRSVNPDDAPVRQRLRELAKDRPAFGVKRLHTMLRRDGLVINHKKVRRLYLEEQLQLKPRRRRRRSSTMRTPRAAVAGPNERWAMDFMHDVLATGQHVRVFTLVDVYSRECVALDVAKSFSGADVARLLSEAGDRAGTLPPIIQCDNGTEFTSTALDHWAYWNRVQLDFSRPGKPVDNSVCEAFNGSLRRECLTRHWFASLAEASIVLSTWRADYNNLRPHTSLGMHTPAQYRASVDYLPRSLR
jgi:putative transposase